VVSRHSPSAVFYDLEVENQLIGHCGDYIPYGWFWVMLEWQQLDMMLGRLAVRNPHDDRYKQYSGKTLTLPILGQGKFR